jgi:Uma2 family endonuclease
MTSKLLNTEEFDSEKLNSEAINSEEFDSEEFDSEEFDSEDIVTELDISHLVIEDDTPVDNLQSEKQQRLLVEPLYSSEVLPRPFLAAANVGLFYKLKGDPIVPDMMLSLGVQCADDFSERRNRSYFVWEFGKVPDVCIEVVSNTDGDELIVSKKSRQKGKTTAKKDIYSQIGVRYYAVFDPLQRIQNEREMNGALLRVWAISPDGYPELTPSQGLYEAGQSIWLTAVGLGLTLWEGPFEEDRSRVWLRWCNEDGSVVSTGAEGQIIERQRAETERQRAETERQRAETERQRAETERQRAERLAERLRAMGVSPDDL